MLLLPQTQESPPSSPFSLRPRPSPRRPPHLPCQALSAEKPRSALPSRPRAPPSFSLPGLPRLRIPEHSPGTAQLEWPLGGADRKTQGGEEGEGQLGQPQGSRNHNCLLTTTVEQ